MKQNLHRHFAHRHYCRLELGFRAFEFFRPELYLAGICDVDPLSIPCASFCPIV